MPKEYPDLTEGQIRTHEALNNMRLKEIVMWCMLVGFFAILVFIFFGAHDNTFRITLSVLDAVIGHSIYPIVAHYFPALKAAKEAENRANAGKTRIIKNERTPLSDSESN